MTITECTPGTKVRMIGHAIDCIITEAGEFHGFEMVTIRSLNGCKETRTNPYNLVAI